MKKVIVSLALSIYMLTGCTNTTDEDAIREYIKPLMEGEITIATMFENHLLEEAAEQFMEKYPDITVTINTGLDTNDFITIVSESIGDNDSESFSFAEIDGDAYMVAIENYLTQLNMRLMSGSAEDIFITADLPVQNFINMGVFEDLSFYLENSPEINNDNHFMNVINAFEDDNSKIWQLPISFDMHSNLVYFDRQLVDESGVYIGEDVKTITYQEAIDFGITLLENTNREDAYLASFFHSTVDALLYSSLDDFINIKDKEVNLDSNEFISVLEKINELNNEEYYPVMDTDFINSSWFDNYFAVNISMGLTHTAYMSLMEDSEVYSALPMSDAKGNVGLFSGNTLAINSASENKDISWEFIKFFLSHEIQSTFFDVPVNRSLYESYLKTMIESANYFNETKVDYDEVDELVKGWISQINNYKLYDNNITTILDEEIEKFIEGEQSAEETAQVLQSRVYRYIRETF